MFLNGLFQCFVLPISFLLLLFVTVNSQPTPSLHSDGLGEITLIPIILHCLLSGQRNTPLKAPALTSVLSPIRSEKYPSPSSLSPTLPQRLTPLRSRPCTILSEKYASPFYIVQSTILCLTSAPLRLSSLSPALPQRLTPCT